MANDVTFRHPDYEAAVADWELVADAAAGQRAVKSKRETYLPKPNKADKSEENKCRYEQYVARALYYNATGRTLAALSGLAFRKWPEIKLPAAMDQFKEDVTGAGVPLIQHSETMVAETMKTGRVGLLVDYPTLVGPASRADQERGGVQPTISLYSAVAITNWRTIKVASRVMLSMVVLKESSEVVDGFGVKCVEQYRVLKLDDAGLYQVEIWQKKKAANSTMEAWEIVDTMQPLMGNGQRWKEIPFQFIGSKNNDSNVDPSPLLDIANVNIAHYRNSADYEDSVYLVGQPQIWLAGLDQNWVEMLEKKGVYIGSRQPLPLPVGGQAGLLQAEPNSLVKEAMDQKERQMAALGARLVTIGTDGPAKTKGQVDSEDATAHSVLSLCCDNVSQAVEQAIRWAQIFSNVTGEAEFSISTEFVAALVDAQMLTALVAAVQAGTMSLPDFWARLRSAGIIRSDKTDEEIEEEIDARPPATGGALDDAAGDDSKDPEKP